MSLASCVTVRVRPDGQRGLFATEPVAAGDILIVYDGPIVAAPTRYSIQVDDRVHIDGTPESNKYLNHSCDPNTHVDWNGAVPCARARRAIAAGEELTCNYLTTDWELREPFTCRCGAAGCYGTIRGFRYLSLRRQHDLASAIPPFMRRRLSSGPAGAPVQAPFVNCYEDATRAGEYAQLEFANTYYLAYRDLPAIIAEHVTGTRAIDFGCGTGRSTRFVRRLGFDAIGVDISSEMIARARAIDPGGEYVLIPGDDLSGFAARAWDLVTAVFTFDNVPAEGKEPLLRVLAALLNDSGKLIVLVSSPEIYTHEWASFSTAAYPENRQAQPGDAVRIVTTESASRLPVTDIFYPEASYREIFARAGLGVKAVYRPLANGDEPYSWVNETRIAPWLIYVLEQIRE